MELLSSLSTLLGIASNLIGLIQGIATLSG